MVFHSRCHEFAIQIISESSEKRPTTISTRPWRDNLRSRSRHGRAYVSAREIGRQEASSTRSFSSLERAIVTFWPKYFNDRYHWRHEILDRNRQSRISVYLLRIIDDFTGNSIRLYILFLCHIFLARCFLFTLVFDFFIVYRTILFTGVIVLNDVTVCKNKLVHIMFKE